MNKFAHALSAALDRCIATKEISERGNNVGFMYREAPVFEHDSGWRFFSGEESDEYTDNPDNFTILSINNIIQNTPEVQTFLQESAGAWEWTEYGFSPVHDWQPKD